MQNDITRFLTDEIYPRLWNHIGELFPDFELRRGNWESPLKINGEPSSSDRKDKTVITKKYPTRAIEQGGESVSLIDLWLERQGLGGFGFTFTDALKAFAQAVGVELPSYDTEEYRQYKEKADLLQKAYKRMKEALFSHELGKPVLDYLTRPKEEGGRGYSVELAKILGLGVITPDVEEELYKAGIVGNKEDRDREGRGFRAYYSQNFPLAIPYESGGHLYGFKFRSIFADAHQKYINTNNLPKRERLYGISALPAQSRNKKDSNLTIVEGELDALHARVVGVENIVAVAGGSGAVVSPEQIGLIKEKGYKYITLLMDSDQTGGKFVEATIPVLAEAGFPIFVARLPEGTGKDTDEFLNSHSGEALQTLIEEATPLCIYEFDKIAKAYTDLQKEGRITEKEFFSFKQDVIRLFAGICYSDKDGKEFTYPVTETDIDRLTERFNAGFGAKYITADSIKAEALAIQTQKEGAKQIREAQNLAKKLEEAGKSGNMEAYFKLVGEAQRLKEVGDSSKFSKLLKPYTLEDVRREVEKEKAGIETEFSFKYLTRKGTEEERLILPSGAVSFICAGTSHGKSKMLQNLALQAVQNGEEGTVLYFSYEEDRERVLLQFLNCYAGVRFCSNNLRTLQSYYKNKAKSRDWLGEEGYRDRLVNCGTSDIETFYQKEKEFNKILEEGRLRVFYEDYPAQTLIGAIKYILGTGEKVKAVFIDYMQLLTLEGSELTIREELKEIGKQLKNLAVQEKLPIVVAAQLNREANTPLDMASQNIAESADIERIANIVLCLWNSSFKPYKKNNNYGRWDSKKEEELSQLGFTIDSEERTLYAILSKNRGGAVSVESILKFDGNTGRITQKELPTQAEQDFKGVIAEE